MPAKEKRLQISDEDFKHKEGMRTIVDAFNATSTYKADPAIGFGTSSRPPLYQPGGGPGPGAYPIKTTMGKLMESHIESPCAFSIRGRVKFGDPNEKTMSKSVKDDPGPGQYDLTGKFISGKDPRPIKFSKAQPFKGKEGMGPGPGQYKTPESMGKQMLSTKKTDMIVGFSKAERGSLVPPGTSDIGPGQYARPPAACAVQVESTKETCGSIKFGTGYVKNSTGKKLNLSEPSPGPGSYKVMGGLGQTTSGFAFRQAPAATMSGRTKFGSPF